MLDTYLGGSFGLCVVVLATYLGIVGVTGLVGDLSCRGMTARNGSRTKRRASVPNSPVNARICLESF